jgi:hypothetical protein
MRVGDHGEPQAHFPPRYLGRPLPSRDRVVFHHDITGTQARTGIIEPAAGSAANHDSATSPWSEPPQSHIAVVRGRGPLVPL